MNDSLVRTRFAPSPTGLLHIGGARTALFAWLFAKTNSGSCLLRIEDTDKERSKQEYTDEIINSFNWMGVDFDEDVVYQSKNHDRHLSVAKELLKSGKAYLCDCSKERLDLLRKEQQEQGLNPKYDGKCRDLSLSESDNTVIRFKNPEDGSVIFQDIIKGEIEFRNEEMDDFIIVRSDGAPTYNLCVVVDDLDMRISHVIRGDDHKINTFKQMQIYIAMKWKVPSYAHIPLIHTIEGKKLSKRDNASTLDDYSKIGIMPDALRNYLLRLGWSYKDKEIFTLDESIECFNLEGIGKSPSKLDMSRILSMNEHYIKTIDENDLYSNLVNYCEIYKEKINPEKEAKIKSSLSFLKNKAKTLEDIFNNAKYIIVDEVKFDENDLKLIDDKAKKIISEFKNKLSSLNDFSKDNLEPIVNELIKNHGTNFKGVGQPLRVALTGSKFGPGLYDIVISLGKDEVEKRLGEVLK